MEFDFVITLCDNAQKTCPTFHYKAAHWFDIRSGYCLFFPGDFIKKTGPDPDASWAFFQTVFSF
jgi:hypothetical protein